MTEKQTEPVRIDNQIVLKLREFCLSKYGKIHGTMGREAAIAINDHIKGKRK